ncbi:MAG TPA: hypothetical protein VLY24_04265 [Bryobacteraceae bacterium]|nr:hypothetical protein [Bryobacteraceae bacterium]
MMFFDKLNHVLTYRVACVTHGRVVIDTCRLQSSRAFDWPCLPPDCAREYRTRPFRFPIAKRDHIVKALPEVWINDFRVSGRDVDSNFPHRGYRVLV